MKCRPTDSKSSLTQIRRRSAMAWSPGFVLGLSPSGGFFRTVQVTMKHDPIRCHVGIHVDFTSILHSHTPLVPKSSLKWTWTGSAFSINESASSVMVTWSHSHVWSGPYIEPKLANKLWACGMYSFKHTTIWISFLDSHPILTLFKYRCMT